MLAVGMIALCLLVIGGCSYASWLFATKRAHGENVKLQDGVEGWCSRKWKEQEDTTDARFRALTGVAAKLDKRLRVFEAGLEVYRERTAKVNAEARGYGGQSGEVEILDQKGIVLCSRPEGHHDLQAYHDAPGYYLKHPDGKVEEGKQ